MLKNYKARWTDSPERSLYNGSNGIVESDYSDKTVCVTPNMANAERIAAALNIVERYSDDEVKAMAQAVAVRG